MQKLKSLRGFEINDIAAKKTYHVDYNRKETYQDVGILDNPESFERFLKNKYGNNPPSTGIVLNMLSK